jgi:hypothetical protein
MSKLTRSSRESAAKEGRCGNGRDGAIKPGRIYESNKQGKVLGVEVEDVESSDKALVSVNFDRSTSTMKFKRAPVSGGGGGGGFIPIVGTVLGGNAQLISPGVTGPTLYAYPLPMSEDGESIMLPPTVEIAAWSDYNLDENYKIGSTLPQLPPGLCYVRLERPSSFGAYSWDAAYQTTVRTKASGTPLFYTAECVYKDSKKDVRVVFDRNIDKTTGTITLTLGATVYTLNNVSITGNVATLTFAENLVFYGEHTLTISAGYFESTDPSPLPVAAINTVVKIKADAFAVTVAYNRHSYQTFYQGDLVLMADLGQEITDSVEITRSVPDIIGQVTTLRSPHTHAYSRFDYGASIAGAAQIGG